jgi:hypothetical protein
MNHPWQQPIRPLECWPQGAEECLYVLFIRPLTPRGWEVITTSGNVWTSDNAMIQPVQDATYVRIDEPVDVVVHGVQS